MFLIKIKTILTALKNIVRNLSLPLANFNLFAEFNPFIFTFRTAIGFMLTGIKLRLTFFNQLCRDRPILILPAQLFLINWTILIVIIRSYTATDIYWIYLHFYEKLCFSQSWFKAVDTIQNLFNNLLKLGILGSRRVDKETAWLLVYFSEKKTLLLVRDPLVETTVIHFISHISIDSSFFIKIEQFKQICPFIKKCQVSLDVEHLTILLHVGLLVRLL